MKLVPLADADAGKGRGRRAPIWRPARSSRAARNGRPGHRRRGARRVAGAGRALPRSRPPGLRRPRVPRDRRRRRVRRHDRPERRESSGDSLLSFTVPRDAAARAAQAVKTAGVFDVSVEPALAKLSVVGVGMRTHTGVATRMFAALAERGININLINTSEVRINVGTDIARGREGPRVLAESF